MVTLLKVIPYALTALHCPSAIFHIFFKNTLKISFVTKTTKLKDTGHNVVIFNVSPSNEQEFNPLENRVYQQKRGTNQPLKVPFWFRIWCSTRPSADTGTDYNPQHASVGRMISNLSFCLPMHGDLSFCLPMHGVDYNK